MVRRESRISHFVSTPMSTVTVNTHELFYCVKTLGFLD